MRMKPLLTREGFRLSPATSRSFYGVRGFFRIAGPCDLVRLVQKEKVNREGEHLPGSKADGAFWFEAGAFHRLRALARADLERQNAVNRVKFARPLDELVGNYMRHVLRSDL